MSRVLVDAGPLVALLNDRDSEHQRCVEALKTLRTPLLTSWPVMAETVYLLQRAGLPHVARGLLKQATGETLLLLQLDGSDIPSINAILAKYEDQRFQLADACLMHLANREGIDTVFTLDRKDFEVYKPQTFAALRLLPE